VVQKELADKRARARKIGGLLGKEDRRWGIVRDEIQEIQKAYGDAKKNPRRTRIESVRDEPEFSDDDFIVEEDCVVLVSRDGWVKRQKEVRDVSTTRLREGDSLVAALSGSTRATAVFFSNFGVAYSARLADIPASTGYGEPIQRLFKLKDGERVVAALSLDDRITPGIVPSRSGGVPKTHAVAISSDGFGLRFSIAPYAEPSTRAGRRFARPTAGAEIVGVAPVHGKEVIILATKTARAMLCKLRDINFLSGPGKGVTVIKLAKGTDHVLGFVASDGDRDLLTVETSRGAQQTISTAKYEVTGRGGKGRELLQRGEFTRVVPRALVIASVEGR
jgi:DNA gyrase subunit A